MVWFMTQRRSYGVASQDSSAMIVFTFRPIVVGYSASGASMVPRSTYLTLLRRRQSGILHWRGLQLIGCQPEFGRATAFICMPTMIINCWAVYGLFFLRPHNWDLGSLLTILASLRVAQILDPSLSRRPVTISSFMRSLDSRWTAGAIASARFQGEHGCSTQKGGTSLVRLPRNCTFQRLFPIPLPRNSSAYPLKIRTGKRRRNLSA